MPTILIADDNSNIQKMAADILSKDCGYKVERVGNGEHAVRKLPDLQPDLILADIFMPVRNGYEVCEYVKNNEQFQHIPVVLLQGKFDPLDEHLMKKVRADGLLMKPFVPKEPLIQMVKSLLEESAAVRAVAEAARAKAAKPHATVEMTRAEVDKLTGKAQEAPPPEAEVPDYSVAARRVEIKAGDEPLAFGDLLGTAPETHGERPGSSEPEGFRASSVAGMEFETEAEGQAKAVEEEEPAEPPMVGGIEEELKQPSPDEPPIKVEFGKPEPMELITDQPVAAPSTVAAGPLPELATSPDEWMASASPRDEVQPVVQESWTQAPAAPAPAPPVAETPPPLGPPAPESQPMIEVKLDSEPVPAPQAYEPPRLEEIPAPPPQMDAVPALAAAPAPRVESFAAPPAVDSALVDSVVEKVLARLQPQIMEQVTREIVRPLAEALLRKEFQK